uniref:Uncharacterized protein n=1 Tax=Leptobrachium leishanense TaxID=445787 RepID=A0A8C5MX14_9ANUR
MNLTTSRPSLPTGLGWVRPNCKPGSFSPKRIPAPCYQNEHKINTYPEVLWIHVQFVGVGVTQVMESGLDAIQVVGCVVESPQDLLAVSLYFGVSSNCNFIGQASERAEIPLGPGVDEKQPALVPPDVSELHLP